MSDRKYYSVQVKVQMLLYAITPAKIRCLTKRSVYFHKDRGLGYKATSSLLFSEPKQMEMMRITFLSFRGKRI